MTEKNPKKWTLAYLRNKVLWPCFSLYIRLRHADWRGYAKCVTCDVVKHYKQLQAGHFIPGRMNSILFDERGTNVQCYHCNIGLKGNPRKYDAFMRRTYGQSVIDELDALSATTRQFTYDELISKWEHYKSEIAKIGIPPDPV